MDCFWEGYEPTVMVLAMVHTWARGPWMPGEYRGEYKLVRKTESGGKVVLQSTTAVRVE